jgi:putative membrane protein
VRTPAWRQIGKEPDYRFTLANERTFLAWIRTALALIAGGVLLEQFATRLQPHALLLALAIGLAVLAALLSLLCYLRWKGNEIAMRQSLPLPTSIAIPLLATGAFVVATVIALLMIKP